MAALMSMGGKGRHHRLLAEIYEESNPLPVRFLTGSV
jgi:hypothetical protein